MASPRLTGLGRGTPIAVARVTDPRYAERHPSATPLHLLLWASVLFNLVLCFVDSHVARLGAGQVILSEVLILAAAVALPFRQPDRSPCRWDFLFALLLVNWLLLSIVRGSIDPKMFRDVAIIPVFIVAGMASKSRNLHTSIFYLHLVILVFALWEAISPTGFVSVFSVSDYFGHTRGQSVEDWTVDNGLYLSSIRPQDRFLFSSLPLHRLSSVFLEPVSLGNYVVLATIWLVTFWRHLPRWMAMTAAVATVLLLIGSDSRLATIACIVLLAAAPFKRHLTSILSLLSAPLVIAATFLAVALFDLRSGSDDFPGRVAYSVEVLRKFGFEDLFGLSLRLIHETEDAGFAYVINSQSLIVAIILWAVLFARPAKTAESRYLHFAIAVYLSLNLIVSWSLFSIKTAALLWFMLGHAIAFDDEPEALIEDSPPRRDPSQRAATAESTATRKPHLSRSSYLPRRIKSR